MRIHTQFPTPGGTTASARLAAALLACWTLCPPLLHGEATGAQRRRQLKVAADAPLRLTARVGKVETEHATYRRFGESLFAQGTDVTVETGRTYEAVLEVDGKVAWSCSAGRHGFAPIHVRMKEGESIDAAVQREAQGQTALGAFALDLPPVVVLPDQSGPLGTSQLTFSGVD